MTYTQLKTLTIGDFFDIEINHSAIYTYLIIDIDGDNYKIKKMITNDIEITNRYRQIIDCPINNIPDNWLIESKRLKRKLKFNKLYSNK